MRKRFWLYKIAGIAFLIFVIILYFLLYFLPTVKEISLYKRQFKDMKQKIADYIKMENAFTYSDSQESQYFERSERDLGDRIPKIVNREEFIALFTRVSNEVRDLARQDGIFNLVINSDSEELKVHAGSLSADKKSLDDLLSFAIRRLDQLRKEQEMRGRQQWETTPKPGPQTGLAEVVAGAKYHTVSLSFTGPLKNALTFINHLPWSHYYLRPDQILVNNGEIFPYFIVFIKIYYVDSRPGAPHS